MELWPWSTLLPQRRPSPSTTSSAPSGPPGNPPGSPLELGTCLYVVAELSFKFWISAVLVTFVISGWSAFKAASAVEIGPGVCATLLRTRGCPWLSLTRSASPATTTSLHRKFLSDRIVQRVPLRQRFGAVNAPSLGAFTAALARPGPPRGRAP